MIVVREIRGQLMKVNDEFFTLMELWEGFENRVYLDGGGAPTIGIGHKLSEFELRERAVNVSGRYIKYSKGLLDFDIQALCEQDTDKAAKCVNSKVKVSLNQNQFNALVSFLVSTT